MTTFKTNMQHHENVSAKKLESDLNWLTSEKNQKAPRQFMARRVSAIAHAVETGELGNVHTIIALSKVFGLKAETKQFATQVFGAAWELKGDKFVKTNDGAEVLKKLRAAVVDGTYGEMPRYEQKIIAWESRKEDRENEVEKKTVKFDLEKYAVSCLRKLDKEGVSLTKFTKALETAKK